MPSFQALGQKYEVVLQDLKALSTETVSMAAAARAPKAARAGAPRDIDAAATVRIVNASSILKSRVDDPLNLAVVRAPSPVGASRGPKRASAAAAPAKATTTLVTQTVIGEGLRLADLKFATEVFGAKLLDEGLDGKVLLKVDTVERVFELVNKLLEREVGSATPNFLRRVTKLAPSAPVKEWAHARIGVPAAWKITKGTPDIRVAILDEGVDTKHVALKAAVVAERDFIGDNGNSAMPDHNDAHGTACAGIVVSRDKNFPGIAPKCSLIGVRIAMSDGTSDDWIYDDFQTSDAIDWSWRQGADILSNSWGGGAPSDAVSRALARARTQGRNGKGAVVCIAAGNAQEPTDFPGSLPGYVTVGASNHKDERKTLTSADGEPWGSNFGDTLRLLAPGVFIWTTDISGAAGYETGAFTKTFNGTSAATPHVAATAALMLSVAPHLSASTIRNMLGKCAKRIAGQRGWTAELGYGRLDVEKAVKLAKDAAPPSGSKTPRKAKKR